MLMLGGTLFVGRHIVESLLARGHEVVLFNRGRTNVTLFPELRRITGDRERSAADLAQLAGERFDVVIDTCGYAPGVLSATATFLCDRAERYVFISSISVYPLGAPHSDETTPTLTLPEDVDHDAYDQQYYGAYKARCEEVVRNAFGMERTFVVRPGLIVGPHDSTDRFTYWPARIARGGDVLAPGPPTFPVQLIDVRDLSEWIVRASEAGRTGTYNATSEPRRQTLGDVLTCVNTVAGSNAHLVWVNGTFLEQHDVEGWMDLPLWLPPSVQATGFLNADVTRALAAGLTLRPLDATITATLAWLADRDPALPWKAGLTPERERELLAAWRERL